jgi:hypothetical protein
MTSLQLRHQRFPRPPGSRQSTGQNIVIPFSRLNSHGNDERMKFVSAILRLMSLAALLGVLIAPVGTVAAENAMATMSNAAMTEMVGIADDMPCCPDEKPAKKPCDNSCPLVIICASSSVFGLQRADWMPVSLTWAPHQYNLAAYAALQSNIAEPPARPPKA